MNFPTEKGSTLPETNVAPEIDGGKMYFLLKSSPFQVLLLLVSGRVPPWSRGDILEG